MDTIVDFVRSILYEDKFLSGSYCEVQKLVDGLSLPYQMIEYINSYMIYCKFCQKPYYQKTSRRVPVSYKRMCYFPLMEILKRIY